MIKFDERGLLVPASIIPTTLDEFQLVFGEMEHAGRRKELFERYIRYSSALKEVVDGDFIQWINGSYCTLKSEPNDIDLVSFLPSAIFNDREEHFKPFSFPNSEQIFGVDAYIVKAYPEGHINYILSQSDKLYWLDVFTKTRPNRVGRKYPKGFLEIIY